MATPMSVLINRKIRIAVPTPRALLQNNVIIVRVCPHPRHTIVTRAICLLVAPPAPSNGRGQATNRQAGRLLWWKLLLRPASTKSVRPGSRAQVLPLECSLCSVKLGLRFTQPRLNEVRVCVAIVMRSDQLRLDDDAVDNFPNSLDCPCKLFGADLQVIARNVSAEHRRSACDFHINGKSAEIGITH